MTIAIIAALPVLAGIVAWLVETDEEAIERVTEECRRAILRSDASAVLSRLTPDATGEGYVGKGPLAPRGTHWIDQAKGRLRDVSLSLRTIEVEGDGARAVWAVQVRTRGREYPRIVRLLLTVDYRREPDGWRIARADAGDWSL
jgi:ketosteroid isomerase-like protein